jgi:hypothetical protein
MEWLSLFVDGEKLAHSLGKKTIILQLLYVTNFQLHVTHAIAKPHSCIRQIAHN